MSNEVRVCADIDVAHHFGAGVYAKEIRVPKGKFIVQHKHKFDHLSVVASGAARVVVDGVVTEHVAPAVLTIKAHKHHAVEAMQDLVWLCIHATDETDPDTVDHEVTEA